MKKILNILILFIASISFAMDKSDESNLRTEKAKQIFNKMASSDLKDFCTPQAVKNYWAEKQSIEKLSKRIEAFEIKHGENLFLHPTQLKCLANVSLTNSLSYIEIELNEGHSFVMTNVMPIKADTLCLGQNYEGDRNEFLKLLELEDEDREWRLSQKEEANILSYHLYKYISQPQLGPNEDLYS